MKISTNIFLAKANLNGSKKKNTVLFMMILSVIAIVVLVGFLNIINTKMNFYKDMDILKQIYILPTSNNKETKGRGITEGNINEVLNIEHIVSCEKQPYSNHQLIDVTKITDEKENEIQTNDSNLNIDEITSSISMQNIDSKFTSEIIKGTSLKNSPVMSCIVPHYIFNEETNTSTDLSNLLGKTLAIKTNYLIHSYEKGEKGYTGNWIEIPETEYNLKVVGVYYYSHERSIDGSASLLISPETAMKLENDAITKSKEYNNNYNLDDYINDPYARDYVVTVDDYENVQEVQDKLISLNFNANIRVGYMNDSVKLFSSIFSGAGTFLASAILLLTVINILISVHNNINERKAEIGLMKALGYRTHQIFYCMYMENIILAVRAILIGGAISAILVGVINIINSNQSAVNRIYTIPIGNFIVMLLIAFAVVLTIPLVCQLIMVKLISRVKPQEAMNT